MEGSGYKFVNNGNNSSTSIEVQPNMQLEADRIVTGALTIGAGAKITITPFPSGPLAASSTLTPLNSLKDNLPFYEGKTDKTYIVSNQQSQVAALQAIVPASASSLTALDSGEQASRSVAPPKEEPVANLITEVQTENVEPFQILSLPIAPPLDLAVRDFIFSRRQTTNSLPSATADLLPRAVSSVLSGSLVETPPRLPSFDDLQWRPFIRRQSALSNAAVTDSILRQLSLDTSADDFTSVDETHNSKKRRRIFQHIYM